MRADNIDCDITGQASQSANHLWINQDERIVIRSARLALNSQPPSAQELLSDRVRGRVRYILDHAQSESVIVPTVLGDVMIANRSAEKEYRVALLWPYKNKKKRFSHDYVISEHTLLKAEGDHALLIDGLVSAALKTVQDQASEEFSFNKEWQDS